MMNDFIKKTAGVYRVEVQPWALTFQNSPAELCSLMNRKMMFTIGLQQN